MEELVLLSLQITVQLNMFVLFLLGINSNIVLKFANTSSNKHSQLQSNPTQCIVYNCGEHMDYVLCIYLRKQYSGNVCNILR